MGVVRWFIALKRTTRAENYMRDTRAEYVTRDTGMDDVNSVTGTHGYAENGDPMHLGEGPP
jgi:hypothetical protein